MSLQWAVSFTPDQWARATEADRNTEAQTDRQWWFGLAWTSRLSELNIQLDARIDVCKWREVSEGQTQSRPVYPSFHLSVLWAEAVSNPRCLSVIHTPHFSLLYSYLTQCFRQLYSQLIFTQTKIVTNEGTITWSSSAIAVCLNYWV